LNNEIHPILFPLGATPILAYTLEFLERGGVEEVFLLSSYPSQITTYLESSRWGERGYPVKTSVISAPTARSVGDFLREVDRRGLVKSDFVLVRGGVLSNLALPSIVEEHRKNKEHDKDVMLMTIVLMQNEGAFSSRRYDNFRICLRRNLRDARLHVLDEANTSVSSEYEFHRCLLSEHVEVYPERKRYVHLSKEIFSRHPNVLFRNDLYDCNVEICTPEVPALFTENFDYEDLRRDFVNGVLTSDLLTKNIYCYIPNHGYGGNITSFEEYWRVRYGHWKRC
jgi:translation initiation factor eIF-2B subunit epsilon